MAKKLKAGTLTSEQAREMNKKSLEVIHKKMKIREILEVWANMKPTKENKEKLKKMGFDGELTNRVLIVAPLLNSVKRGDIKAITLALDLLGENPAKALELKKLEAEIKKLETQKLLLEKELKGQSEDDRIEVISDIPLLDHERQDI